MKKVFLSLLLMSMVLIQGCEMHTHFSYTFDVETGDKIKVTLETGEGYAISQEDGRFTISQNDEEILQGIFLTESGYNQYYQTVSQLTDKEVNDNVIYYEVNGNSGREYDYLLKVKDSHTGIIIGSLSGKEKAQTAFQRLTFEVVVE